MLKKLVQNKKIMTLALAISIVFCMCAVCFADGSTGAAGVASTLESSLSATNIWDSIAPMLGIVAIVTLVAVARRILNKNLKSAKSGGSGKV